MAKAYFWPGHGGSFGQDALGAFLKIVFSQSACPFHRAQTVNGICWGIPDKPILYIETGVD